MIRNLINKIFRKKVDKTEQLKKAVQIIEQQKMNDTIQKVIDSYTFTIKNHPQYAHSDLFRTKSELIEIEFKDLLTNTIGWQFVESEMFKIYEKLYTKAELNQMIKFYSSDLGKKIISTQEDIDTMKMHFVNSKLQDKQQELSNILTKVESMPFNN